MSYLTDTAALLTRLATEQQAPISAAAAIVADTLVHDGLVHVFGSGHSHMLALEGFYRAGGLAAVDPILVPSLMLHSNAVLSTALERTAGIGSSLLADLQPGPHDSFILVSNSGGNRVAIELARGARERGLSVIAIVSAAHARSALTMNAQAPGANAPGGNAPHEAPSNLIDLADVVIDNLGAVGDAATTVAGVASPMGPTSTVTGAAIIHAVAIEAAALAAAAGAAPAVFSSSNVAGGDARNIEAISRYRGRVRSL